jgi:oligopeptide transport system permease protein
MSAGIGGYILRRVLWAIPVLFVISFLVFYMLRLAPGDPVDTLLGQRFDEEVAERLKAKYGYDEPIYVQYVKYMKNLAQGDMGVSTRHQDFTVKEVILPKIWVSTQLGFMALVLVFAIGIPVGLWAALARGTYLDPLLIGSWLFIDAIPVFVLITFAQFIFAVQLGWVSVSWDGIASPNIILPVLLMSMPGVAGVARLMRASVIQVLNEDYVRTARAKGLRERTVIMSYIARNALLPVITVIGLSLPGIAGGSLFIELLFGIPGIGNEAFQAVLAPDYDLILGLVLFASFLFVAANLAVDIAYAFVDPRIRLGETRG